VTGGFVCCKLWLDLRLKTGHDAACHSSKTSACGNALGPFLDPPDSCSQFEPNLRRDSTALAGREASEFANGPTHSQGPICTGAGRDFGRNIDGDRRWLSSRPATWHSRPEAASTVE